MADSTRTKERRDPEGAPSSTHKFAEETGWGQPRCSCRGLYFIPLQAAYVTESLLAALLFFLFALVTSTCMKSLWKHQGTATCILCSEICHTLLLRYFMAPRHSFRWFNSTPRRNKFQKRWEVSRSPHHHTCALHIIFKWVYWKNVEYFSGNKSITSWRGEPMCRYGCNSNPLFLRHFTPLLISFVKYQWKIRFCSEDLHHDIR